MASASDGPAHRLHRQPGIWPGVTGAYSRPGHCGAMIADGLPANGRQIKAASPLAPVKPGVTCSGNLKRHLAPARTGACAQKTKVLHDRGLSFPGLTDGTEAAVSSAVGRHRCPPASAPACGMVCPRPGGRKRRLSAGRHSDAPRGALRPARRAKRIRGGCTGRSLDRQTDENCRKSSPPLPDIFTSDLYQSMDLRKKRYFKKR